jgi:hypothetical protein
MARKFFCFMRLMPILASLLLLCPAAGLACLGFDLPGLSGGFLGDLSTDILWAGSWDYDGSLINRGDIRLRAHKPALALRAQVTDKRPDPFAEGFDQGLTAFAGGLYHEATGSRLLWGILDEGGLPARIKNVWNRGMPYPEQRQGAIGELHAEPSTTKEPGAYLWLGSPWLGPARGFGSLLVDAENQAAFDGGLEARLGKKSALRLEGFYTRNHLAAKSPAAWFSETPPLPERDQDILAGSVYYNNPVFAAAADIAWSETFAYGKDLYGNLGFRIGDRPWRLSLAADAAGSRYVGRDGAATGAGFRAGARLERRGKRSSLFRANATIRAAGLGEPPYRGSGQLYYHFPTAPLRSTHFFWPSRVSLTASRDAENIEKIADSITALGAFKLWKIPLVFQGSLHGIYADDGIADAAYEFGSAKISAEASYAVSLFQFGAKLSYAMDKKGEAKIGTGASASIRGKWGRFNIKANTDDVSRDWDFGVSWRMQL